MSRPGLGHWPKATFDRGAQKKGALTQRLASRAEQRECDRAMLRELADRLEGDAGARFPEFGRPWAMRLRKIAERML